LTLCYGSADDDVTDIFISEVEPYSVAARDGRIREGDQILQVCNVCQHDTSTLVCECACVWSVDPTQSWVQLHRPSLWLHPPECGPVPLVVALYTDGPHTPPNVTPKCPHILSL